jgi:hypothetical protein
MMSSEIIAPITYPPVEDAVEAAEDGVTISNEIAIAFICIFFVYTKYDINAFAFCNNL